MRVSVRVFEEELWKVRTTSVDFYCFLSEDWGEFKNGMYVEDERDKAFLDAIKVVKMKLNSFTSQSGQSQIRLVKLCELCHHFFKWNHLPPVTELW